MIPEPTLELFDLRHAATDRATIVVVPRRRLFAIDGVGAPGALDFQHAATTLRDAADAIRVALALPATTRRPPIECAWWTHPELEPDRVPEAFLDRSTWHWQQMIEIARAASTGVVEAAIDATRRKAGRAAPLLRVVEIEEGEAAQILHLGPRATEAAAVRLLYAAIDEAGLRPHGHIHEIVLADPEMVPPERGRLIIRVPIQPRD